MLKVIGGWLWWTSLALALTPLETEVVNARLERFYRWPVDPHAMNQPTPKFSARTGQPARLSRRLQMATPLNSHPLVQQAQRKATQDFRRYHCEKVLKPRIPGLSCDRSLRSEVQGNDRVEDLADSWLNYVSFVPSDLPTRGRSERPLWSDDYWAMRWGLTSYRYGEGKKFPNYLAAVTSYFQPKEFFSFIGLDVQGWESETLTWSPAEKYDLTVGDTAFTLTNEQKEEGKESAGSSGDVEEWMGLCHGWSPAAIMSARPEKPVTVTGAHGRPVTWYPNDIKALLTLAWSNGNYASNFIGGRCDNRNPRSYANGRVAESECFDNNPATFHLSLANLIGKAKTSFVMDKTFDYEVWNQPIVSYEFTYFNPLKPSERSADWAKVAVPYDARFKARDRFQSPLTRGRIVAGPLRLRKLFHRGGGDTEVKKIVGVIAAVVWLSEVTPEHSPDVQEDEWVRELYTYDLEIGEEGGVPVVLGGEWHDNNHPDFLFVPKKYAFAEERWDAKTAGYSGLTPDERFTANAADASFREGYPLCSVLKYLVKESTGEDTVRCRAPVGD